MPIASLQRPIATPQRLRFPHWTPYNWSKGNGASWGGVGDRDWHWGVGEQRAVCVRGRDVCGHGAVGGDGRKGGAWCAGQGGQWRAEGCRERQGGQGYRVGHGAVEDRGGLSHDGRSGTFVHNTRPTARETGWGKIGVCGRSFKPLCQTPPPSAQRRTSDGLMCEGRGGGGGS